jgi:hypothetical protein
MQVLDDHRLKTLTVKKIKKRFRATGEAISSQREHPAFHDITFLHFSNPNPDPNTE